MKKEHEAFSCSFCPKRWSSKRSLSEKLNTPGSKRRTRAYFQPGTPPPLCLHRCHSHNKMDQAFSLSNWTVGRPGNEAIYYPCYHGMCSGRHLSDQLTRVFHISPVTLQCFLGFIIWYVCNLRTKLSKHMIHAFTEVLIDCVPLQIPHW